MALNLKSITTKVYFIFNLGILKAISCALHGGLWLVDFVKCYDVRGALFDHYFP